MGYYAGDPGFFSMVKSIVRRAAGMITGVGGIAGKMISKIPTGVRGGMIRVGSKIAKHPVISAAAGAGALALGGGGMAGRAGNVGPPGGKHPFRPPLTAPCAGTPRARAARTVTQ